jgi:hypothetical protein
VTTVDVTETEEEIEAEREIGGRSIDDDAA